jgi:hypothetical protein
MTKKIIKKKVTKNRASKKKIIKKTAKICIGYKLTNEKMQTYNNTQWELQEWKETSGKGELCSPGWLHYYNDPLLAAFLNPIHAKFAAPRLFQVEVAPEARIKEDRGLKLGCTKMRLVQELQFPQVTMEQRVKFGILCALEVYDDAKFVQWAAKWLDGADRSKKAAWAAAWAAAAADDAWAAAAADDAWAAAADAARAAARAADAAVDAAGAADAAYAAYAAARAADAAAWAAEIKDIDLIAIAKKAME